MSIMRTKGMGTINSPTPKTMKHYWVTKNDIRDIKPLTIQNFDKDITSAVFYDWVVISADELDEVYMFQLRNRINNKLRVYISLGRFLQYSEPPYYPEMMYQCYIHADNYDWSDTSWFRVHDITYKNFWRIVEGVVDKYYPVLPF